MIFEIALKDLTALLSLPIITQGFTQVDLEQANFSSAVKVSDQILEFPRNNMGGGGGKWCDIICDKTEMANHEILFLSLREKAV